jgi:hypothetical protein
MTLIKSLINNGHTHRFVVSPDSLGWEVREEEDAIVLWHSHRNDWHRVERDARLFDLKANSLVDEGWIRE